MTGAKYHVVLNGDTALVYRTADVTRRRWFGLRESQDTVCSLVGAYACAMSLGMTRHIGRPGTLDLQLGSYSVSLSEFSDDKTPTA